MLHRGHSGDICELVSTLWKYFRKDDLFACSLLMLGGDARDD